MNQLVSLDDMTAIVFGLGVARIDTDWALAVCLIAGAIAIRFAKAFAVKYNVPVSGPER